MQRLFGYLNQLNMFRKYLRVVFLCLSLMSDVDTPATAYYLAQICTYTVFLKFLALRLKLTFPLNYNGRWKSRELKEGTPPGARAISSRHVVQRTGTHPH